MRKHIIATIAGTLLVISATRGQTNLSVTAFGMNGVLTFHEVTNAAMYHVEWSTNLSSASWSTSAPPGMADIPAVGTGTRSVTLGVGQVQSHYRVVATVTNSANGAPAGMVLIPSGSFTMGSAFVDDGDADELPRNTVTVSEFYMDMHEVTKALWDEVRAWATNQGYAMTTGGGIATNHPVNFVNWFDVVRWCNARSEREGLTPVYYTNAGFTAVYKTGLVAPFVNWNANGYRLPTEAEWEKAARGGTEDTRFPWSDFTNKISWAKANYYGASNSYSYDLDGADGAYHPTFVTASFPYTSPVGSFAPNGYGLYDMAGNVWEWCWDWYQSNYYTNMPTSDPRGPAGPLSDRVRRGGSWNTFARAVRVAERARDAPSTQNNELGFRCVRVP